jgi:hypothetical protein
MPRLEDDVPVVPREVPFDPNLERAPSLIERELVDGRPIVVVELGSFGWLEHVPDPGVREVLLVQSGWGELVEV